MFTDEVSSKDAIRWRPSQVGWRPALLRVEAITTSNKMLLSMS